MSRLWSFSCVILLTILGITLVLYQTCYNPGKLVDVRAILNSSREVIDRRFNEENFYLKRAKLKGASNSYIEPVYLNDRNNHILKRDQDIKLENATLLVLCRNWELNDILSSMRSLEDKFNKDYHYPWTFLNDVPFDEDFIRWTTEMASGKIEFGLIPPEDWNRPTHIDEQKFDESIQAAIDNDVLYGGSKSYRNMCHFNSGYFFRQELTLKYDYYFRVEPGVEYFCDFQMDPFRLLREQGKKYSFVVSLYEYTNTIETLWDNVEDFINQHPQYLHPNNSIDFITDKTPIGTNALDLGMYAYNLCHFWSNFEIGDLNFFRSQVYLDYFQYLSDAGGFYYERWGDAPVHSIAAALFLDKNEIMHFDEIGYTHVPFFTYPEGKQALKYRRCVVPKDSDNINVSIGSCLPRWWKFGSGKKFLKEYYHEDEYVKFRDRSQEILR